MKTAKTFYLFCLIALISISLSTFAFSQIPQKINYSGIITDSSGNPLVDGSYDVEFKLYDVSSGGSALWSETWNSSTTQVTTVQGIFNVTLGSHTVIPSSFFNEHPATYLGVKVGTDSEMTPRQQFTSVAYSFTSGDGTPQGGIIMWSGSIASIPSGWALCDGTNGTPDLRDRFVVGAGLGYAVGNTGGMVTNNISHSHAGPNHNHGINAESPGTTVAGYHNHTFSGTTGSDNNQTTFKHSGTSNPETVSETPHQHSFSGTTSAGGNHSHTVNSHSHGSATAVGGTGQTSASGSTSLENRPPYYALAFIIKL